MTHKKTWQSKYFKKLSNKKGIRRYSWAGAAVLVAAILGILYFNFGIQKTSNQTLSSYASNTISKCANEGYRPSCYDKEIPKLMDKISMEDAFHVTALVQQQDPTYQYCHILGHELSAREVDKDPSKWKEVVSRCPSGMCSNGCIHGGFQERFRSDHLDDNQINNIKSDLETICEKRSSWNPTGLEQASCYHALGHLTMYMTSADTKKSLTLCDEIALKPDGRDFTQLCYDGVFMQIFQPLEPEDFALVKGKQPVKSSLLGFCNQYSGHARGSCISESWPLFITSDKSAGSTIQLCEIEDSPEKDRCYNGLAYVVTAQLNFNQDKIFDYCSGFPSNRSGNCFANASSRLIETDYRNIANSVSLCKKGQPFDSDNLCFKELIKYSTYNFHSGSVEFNSLCQSLPDPWGKECFDKGKNKKT